MYPNPIPLNDGSADVNYAHRGIVNERSLYKNASADLSTPQTFQLAYAVSKPGTIAELNSALAKLDRVVEDAEGNQGVITTQLVQRYPVKIATAVQLEEELNKMKDFLTNTDSIDKFIAQEY